MQSNSINGSMSKVKMFSGKVKWYVLCDKELGN